jgi:TPR repeat protein
MLELDEREYWAYLLLSIIRAQRGQLEEAVESGRKAYSRAPWYLPVVASFAAMLRLTGDSDGTGTMLLKLGDGQAYGAQLGFVNYRLLCSEVDLAADWAEKAVEQRDPALHAFLRFPYAQELHGSSRWPALAKMKNLGASL